jgi:hypothetical protein
MKPGMVAGVGQIAVSCLIRARATRFERDTFGLPLLFEAGVMAFCDCAGVQHKLRTRMCTMCTGSAGSKTAREPWRH